MSRLPILLLLLMCQALRCSCSRYIQCTFQARFTPLTTRLIRLEHSPRGQFEDRASLSFIYRNRMPEVHLDVANTSRWCNISTTALSLSYDKQAAGAGFGPELRATSVISTDSWSWQFGDTDSENLLGTLAPTPSADLAGCCSNPNATAGSYDPKYPLEPGLLSKVGWALVNDSSTPLVDWALASDRLEDAWISNEGRNGSEDFVLFGCGTDYRGCMSDFVKAAGKIGFPSRAGLGVWWSRHWGDESGNKQMVDAVGPMSEDRILKDVVDGFAAHQLPLQVLVLDMEWHEMMKPDSCSQFAGKAEWGGYSWNKTLFANPAAFVEQLHRSGIQLALNYHPDSGIDICQDKHDQMAAALGMDPTEPLGDLDGPNSLNKTYVDAYFKYMIDPSLADIAWTDTPKATTWTNWLYVRYPALKNKRTINFSRYGGLGNHRTPTGFSGDTQRKWDTLEYEVYMTSRASNVGFGWWSHDIGGFSAGFIDSDWHTETPELYLRWLQFGAFSPILRMHCRYCEQRIWTWYKYDTLGLNWFDAMSRPLKLRHGLVPYIYTHAALRTVPSGESLIQPMYWDPEAAKDPRAYMAIWERQYFFGREFLVAPITEASKNETVNKSIWLPGPTDWFLYEDMSKHSPGVVSRSFSLAEIPLYVREGSVIPTQIGLPLNDSATLVWLIPPGMSGNGAVYDDDGSSMDFTRNMSKITTLSYSRNRNEMRIGIASDGVGYAGAIKSRAHHVWLKGEPELPLKALCDGETVGHAPAGASSGIWRAAEGGCVIACSPSEAFQKHEITIHF